jgi:hypothetical protein
MNISTTSDDVVPGYGLARPTHADAHAALVRIKGDAADDVLAALAGRACGPADGCELPCFRRLVDAFLASTDALVRLCGQSLRVRLLSFDRLSVSAAR